MNDDFINKIKKYPYILKSYEDAIIAIKETGHQGEVLDFYLSRLCRAWFFEKHLKVEREASDQENRDISKSPIVPFRLSSIQLDILNKFEKRMFESKKFRQRIMKCRRARVSTIYLAIGYHIARFNENKKGYVFCDKLETSRKLRRILDVFYQTDDLIGKPVIGKRTLSEGLYLHNADLDKDETSKDSFILLGSGEQKNSGVGGSLDFMQWSECALTADQQKHWSTISPSLQGALFDIAESTPSLTGQDEIIYPEFESPSENCDSTFFSWMDVEEYRIDDPEKIKSFVPYEDHNLYGKEVEILNDYSPSIPQMVWRRFKLDEMKSLTSFRNMFPISKEEAFLSSAGLFFHKDLIASTKPDKVKESKNANFADQGIGISLMYQDVGSWRVYSPMNVGNNYLVTVDIPEGRCADKDMRDSDYAVATVWNLRYPIEEVATIRDRIPPEVLAEQVYCAARYYREALVVPELNGPGLAFLVRLRQLYSNIYRNQRYASGSFVLTDEYGFRTTSATKVHALSCLLLLLREKGKGIKIYSDIYRTEMGKFAQKGFKYSAMSGFHDDTITNLWLLAVCVSQTPSLVLSNDSDGQFESSVRCFEPTIDREILEPGNNTF